MQDDQARISEYRAYMKMYASMMADLSEIDEYLLRLIQGEGLTDFENTIRSMIEEAKCTQ